ncbi:TetR/AcrR family transcriptional regulator [Amycolatopsis suaedae]|uniref:TetR family transcriptional regulator n=1 Tax=Amycolatopsis suaedae TaxID=2510978 RepID=A0A4Q7J1D8_9PSEU|nr:TetR/AcrR family transcriptional regulator [Amycolatopsis suaedae]RZQ60256.1 TetR family transcriptional regulator [Amycolatopsis suaedae]
MPRHADPVLRRRQVADALLRVAGAEGLDAASIPRIARELGATTGLVQTYFSSKDELLLFAFDHLGELVNDRVERALSSDSCATIGERLFLGMSVLASADESEQDGEGRIWLAFLARAAVHPALRARHVAGTAAVRDKCRYAFAMASNAGEVDPGLDPGDAALALAAFADGVALQRALEPELVTKDVARGLLRGYLDRIFARQH